jgi:hypothetical protein
MGTAIEVEGLKPTPLGPGASHLPKSIRGQLTAPGITWAEKVQLGELALNEAKETKGIGDDIAASKFLESLYKTYKSRTLKEIKRVRKELHRRVSPARRKKLEAELERLLSGLGEVKGNLGNLANERHEAAGTRAEEGKTREEEWKQRKEEEREKAIEAAQAAREKPWQDLEAGMALAELTEGTADDLAVLQSEKGLAAQRLAEAQASGNTEEIINWAHTLKSVEEAIKGLQEGGEGQAQLAEEIKALRETIAEQTRFAKSAVATNSATAWKALADIMSGQLGPRTNLQAQTAGNGSVGTF